MNGIVPGEDQRTRNWSSILPRPRNDQKQWTEHLDLALEMLEDVQRRLGVAIEYSIGGGTMLMRRYRHRISRDLDLFVRDASLIRALSPQLNDFTAARFPKYAESASAIKFVVGDQEIDIIVAPALTEPPYLRRRVAGRLLPVEEPREIIAKKLLYRGRSLTHRDVFDLAVVANRSPEQIVDMPKVIGIPALKAVETRLRELEPSFRNDLQKYVRPLPAGKSFMDTAP
jgi:hypothetical protein